jgi:NAD(P)-dependent dehydrogenase (short-subunit alcohol dehydrogenase family)
VPERIAAPNFGLAGRTVVLTGAAGGIGAGLAQGFATQGVRLVLVDRDQAGLLRLAQSLPCEVVVVQGELNSDRDVSRLAAQIAAQFPAIDVLVNNAGVEYPTPLRDLDAAFMQRWSQLLDNNVGSMMRLTRALLPCLVRGASVINQSSIWGLKGVAEFSAYVASKHAVVGLTRSLAWELAPQLIRVNAVCPGWIRTDAALKSLEAMAQSEGRAASEVLASILGGQALPGFLEPADLVGTFLFLASDSARALTGQALAVDNGEVMH